MQDSKGDDHIPAVILPLYKKSLLFIWFCNSYANPQRHWFDYLWLFKISSKWWWSRNPHPQYPTDIHLDSIECNFLSKISHLLQPDLAVHLYQDFSVLNNAITLETKRIYLLPEIVIIRYRRHTSLLTMQTSKMFI